MVESEHREADELRRLLPGPASEKATRILEMITRCPELRDLYDDRLKAERDQRALVQDTLAQGRLVGRVQTLQHVLSDQLTDESKLLAMDLETLKKPSNDLDRLHGEIG